jgi:hypothetical protein
MSKKKAALAALTAMGATSALAVVGYKKYRKKSNNKKNGNADQNSQLPGQSAAGSHAVSNTNTNAMPNVIQTRDFSWFQVFTKGYMTGNHRVGYDDAGNFLPRDVLKYLFIDYVVGLLEAGATREKTFTSEWGAEIKRENRSTLKYKDPKGAVLPITKVGEALNLPQPRVEDIGALVKFVMRPAVQGQAGWTDFTGQGTIVRIDKHVITLAIDMSDVYFTHSIQTHSGEHSGEHNVKDGICKLLKLLGYETNSDHLRIAIDGRFWKTLDAPASVNATHLNEDELAYTTVLNASEL